jgi:hypothetical protein
MRNSDIIFFSTMGLASIMGLTCAFLDVYQDWMSYWWWVVLIPIAFCKVFFPKSKFVNWLEKNYESKKHKG